MKFLATAIFADGYVIKKQIVASSVSDAATQAKEVLGAEDIRFTQQHMDGATVMIPHTPRPLDSITLEPLSETPA